MTSANVGVIWQVIAACYDNPIPGYGTNTVGNLRLWESKPVNEFKLDEFNEGHYVEVRYIRCTDAQHTTVILKQLHAIVSLYCVVA